MSRSNRCAASCRTSGTSNRPDRAALATAGVIALRLPRRRRMKPLERREAIQGLLFLSPWIVGFVVFTALPTVATLIFSFTNVDLSRNEPFEFVGLANYQKL